MDAFFRGWRRFISFNCAGQRFIGRPGPGTDGVTIDVYDSSGDYLASGIDGLTITVHGNAQDQLGQIIKRESWLSTAIPGKLSSTAQKAAQSTSWATPRGGPLINSVGKPRVIINGTCLDFLGESFMAGDLFNGGGFVILNGITFDDEGRVIR